MKKGSGTFFVYERFAVAECNEAMKAPVGLSSDRTVLRSKMEGPRPDKFQFAVLVPSRVWVRHLVRAIRFG